jgi:hypothetical protein
MVGLFYLCLFLLVFFSFWMMMVVKDFCLLVFFFLDDDDGEDLLVVVGVVLGILNVADMLLISLLFERSEYYTVIGLLYPLLL